jgi:hypothetical protein
MRQFLTTWGRGVSILAFYFCLSIVVAGLGFIGGVLPPVISVPILIVLGAPVIYRVSRWLAPDLFTEDRLLWRRRLHRGDK